MTTRCPLDSIGMSTSVNTSPSFHRTRIVVVVP